MSVPSVATNEQRQQQYGAEFQPSSSVWPLSNSEIHVIVLSTCLKLLLFPAYRSTDFDVHQNWLRITNDLPLKEWYYDEQSEWTLDYPPFFAYFEKALSLVARQFDSSIAAIGSVTPAAVYFQRASVVASEVVLVFAALLYSRTLNDRKSALVLTASLVAHPAFIIVDSIHFQYNAFLFGLLLLSLTAAKKERPVLCAALFATLLNFKHIFMYISLPFFVYLLRSYCFQAGRLSASRVLELGAVVGGVCALSFGPFLWSGGIDTLQQIFSRLFPFQRGLNHAYWAPNAWALVTFLDRCLIKLYVARGRPVSELGLHSASKGLIGDAHFGVLPDISPRMCFALTLACNAIGLTKLWLKPNFTTFVHSIAFSAYASFLFGWHVHEKAVLLFLVPLTITALQDQQHFKTYLVASFASIAALFPLLIRTDETVVKLAYSLLWAALVFPAMSALVSRREILNDKHGRGAIAFAENTYLVGLAVLWPLASPLSSWYAYAGKHFVPLMATSVYCSLGVCWSFLRLCWSMLVIS